MINFVEGGQAALHGLTEVWQWLKGGWPTDFYTPPLITLCILLLSWWTYVSVKRRERFKLGIDLILKLGERFEGDAMIKRRAAASRALVNGDAEKASLDVAAVFDFFEEVGYLLDRGAIPIDAVEIYFSFWIEPYYSASTDFRAARKDNGVWIYFDAMARSLAKFRDQQKLPRPMRWTHPLLWHLYRKYKKDNKWDGSMDVTKVMNEEIELKPSKE